MTGGSFGFLARFSHKFRGFATNPFVLVGADHRVGPLPISTHYSVRIVAKIVHRHYWAGTVARPYALLVRKAG